MNWYTEVRKILLRIEQKLSPKKNWITLMVLGKGWRRFNINQIEMAYEKRGDFIICINQRDSFYISECSYKRLILRLIEYEW